MERAFVKIESTQHPQLLMLNQLFPDTHGLSAFRIYQENKPLRLLFAYNGAMNEQITEGIIGLSEHTVAAHTDLAGANRKLSFLLVECFQNILRHRSKNKPQEVAEHFNEGMFSFRSFDRSFFINSINRIDAADRERLTETVEKINRLSKDELKQLYRDRLKHTELSERGGAGLGLIELARKSGQPIQYEFDTDPYGITSFHNQVSFVKDNDPLTSYKAPTEQLNRLMNRERVMFLYKGDLSQQSILPLLSMVEVNTEGAWGSVAARKVGHVLIELLQNISRHAIPHNGVKEGVISIGESQHGIVLRSGNRVTLEQKAYIEKTLSAFAACEPDALRQMHRQMFKESLKREDRKSSGLGLIQIARDGQGRIDYRFDEMNDEGFSFFSFGVTV